MQNGFDHDSGDLFEALNSIVRGDDGEIHENGALFIEWLRGICHWGDSPLDEDHYSGDLIMLGRIMGKQEVFSKILEALNIPAVAERTHQLQEHVRREMQTGNWDD